MAVETRAKKVDIHDAQAWLRQTIVWGQAPERRGFLEVFHRCVREYVKEAGQHTRQQVNYLLKDDTDIMNLAENFEHWTLQLLEEGEQKGRQEGQQQGLKNAIQVVLKTRFAEAGLNYWARVLAPVDIAPWSDILEKATTAADLASLATMLAVDHALVAKDEQ